MQTDRPHLSDDDLLAEIFVLGHKATNVGLCSVLAVRFGPVKRHYLDERLERLQAAQLVSCSSPSKGQHPTIWSVRLTAAGVERLCALQREPLAPKMH
jgi:hypothetical protein